MEAGVVARKREKRERETGIPGTATRKKPTRGGAKKKRSLPVPRQQHHLYEESSGGTRERTYPGSGGGRHESKSVSKRLTVDHRMQRVQA